MLNSQRQARLIITYLAEYYSYTWAVACGISLIKVNRTKVDWRLRRDSFNKLASRLNLEWWVKELNPILDEFINVFDGKINLIHWRSIFKKVFEEVGCERRIQVDGWITKFYPYIGRDKPERRNEWNGAIDPMTDIPKGVTDVDINWIYDGKTIPLKIYTGFVGIQVDTTRKMLKASRGYALRAACGRSSR